MSALIKAIEQCHFKRAKLLIERGADVNQQDSIQGTTPLIVTCFIENEATACRVGKWLMENEANPGIQDKSGASSLMYACALGRQKLVKLLLTSTHKDFDINASDGEGNTALLYSVLQGNEKITEAVIDALNMYSIRGVDKANFRGETPLIKASKLGRVKCMEMLLTKGKASPNARDFEYRLTADEWKKRIETLSLTSADKMSHQRTYVNKNLLSGNDKKCYISGTDFPRETSFATKNTGDACSSSSTLCKPGLSISQQCAAIRSSCQTRVPNILTTKARKTFLAIPLESEKNYLRLLDESYCWEMRAEESSKTVLTKLMKNLSEDITSSFRPSCKPLLHYPEFESHTGNKEEGMKKTPRNKRPLRLWRISGEALSLVTLNRHPKLFSKKDFSTFQAENGDCFVGNQTKFDHLITDKSSYIRKRSPRELWKRILETPAVVNPMSKNLSGIPILKERGIHFRTDFRNQVANCNKKLSQNPCGVSYAKETTICQALSSKPTTGESSEPIRCPTPLNKRWPTNSRSSLSVVKEEPSISSFPAIEDKE